MLPPQLCMHRSLGFKLIDAWHTKIRRKIHTVESKIMIKLCHPWYVQTNYISSPIIRHGKSWLEIRIMLTTFGHVYNCIYSYLNIPFRRQTEFIFIICGYLIYIWFFSSLVIINITKNRMSSLNPISHQNFIIEVAIKRGVERNFFYTCSNIRICLKTENICMRFIGIMSVSHLGCIKKLLS